MSVVDGIKLQKLFGGTYGEWEAAVQKGDLEAIAYGIIVIARRTDPAIGLDDLGSIRELVASLGGDKESGPHEPFSQPA